MATGECVQTLEGHSGSVKSAQFSPDGTNIVSASDDKTVRVWSVATGECVQTLEGHSDDGEILRSLARMARISYRRVGQDCARVERGDRVCADIGGAVRMACGAWRDIGGAQCVRSLARMARISYRRVGTRLCACGAWRQGVCADIGGAQRWGEFCAV